MLRLKGWRILDRRVRVAGGEVDLVARRGRIVAFIEVKQRSSLDNAAESIDAYRLRRVIDAAQQLCPRYLREGDDARIDAVLVAPGRWPRHLENIWHG